MSQDKGFSFDLYPAIDAELEAAYERHGIADITPEGLANKALATVVASTAEANKNTPEIDGISEMFKDKLDNAWAAADTLFDGRLAIPNLSDAEFQGTDWNKLEAAWNAMVKTEMEPEIVIAPNVQSLEFWASLYQSLSHDLDTEEDEATGDTWQDLTRSDDVRNWSVSVISGSSEPNILGVSHDVTKSEVIVDLPPSLVSAANLQDISKADDIFPDVNAYLTLQALRLKKSLWTDLVDGDYTRTILKGTINGGKTTVVAFWDPHESLIYFDHFNVDYKDRTIGVRPTIRG